jgi:hypothetical protein
MSDTSAKKRAHYAVFEACPDCIYCGGAVPATTIDHVPPRIIFRGRQRPKGLEFASCKSCNEGTSRADLVAGLFSRVAPDAATEAEQEELKKLLAATNNNVPGLLEELQLSPAETQGAHQRLPGRSDAGFLRSNGPLVSKHMRTFAAKLGFALYYEATRQIVPSTGAVAARWFSNVDRLEGTFPQTVFDMLLPPQTLRQGKLDVADQFGYQWRLTDDDSMAMFLATFRQSFAVLAFVAKDRTKLKVETKHPLHLVTPRNIMMFLNDEVMEDAGPA